MSSSCARARPTAGVVTVTIHEVEAVTLDCHTATRLAMTHYRVGALPPAPSPHPSLRGPKARGNPQRGGRGTGLPRRYAARNDALPSRGTPSRVAHPTRHCEGRSPAAIHEGVAVELDCHAATRLAMTYYTVGALTHARPTPPVIARAAGPRQSTKGWSWHWIATPLRGSQ